MQSCSATLHPKAPSSNPQASQKKCSTIFNGSNIFSETPADLMTEPLGARLPVKMQCRLPYALDQTIGELRCGLGLSAVLNVFSPTDLPLTVGRSKWSKLLSSLMTAGTPPAASKSSNRVDAAGYHAAYVWVFSADDIKC